MSRPYAISTQRLLYPMMWIGAFAVIVLSIVGIASLTGWMPQALESGSRGTAATAEGTPNHDAAKPGSQMQKSGPAFQCVECGVVDSVRDIERRSGLRIVPVAAVTGRGEAAVSL